MIRHYIHCIHSLNCYFEIEIYNTTIMLWIIQRIFEVIT